MIRGIGLRDKLYWRGPDERGLYHCYKKTGPQQFVALCRLPEKELVKVGGQACRRPPVLKRCSRCDVAEMKRRGWEESGPP